jgi:L-lysine exporter family protein LysE/ArgO
MSPTLTGFWTSLSLILAIGAQNAFILRQGLRRQHVFILCLICALSDAILITAGVLGFGALVELWPLFPTIMRYAGAAFLIVYGLMRLYSAYKGGETLEAEGQNQALWPAIVTCLVFTWANPHVYLDTLGLLGAISTQYPWGQGKLAFGIGAVLASFVFFFSLGYGARLLTPIMASERAWKLLDLLIGIVMLILAYWLLTGH